WPRRVCSIRSVEPARRRIDVTLELRVGFWDRPPPGTVPRCLQNKYSYCRSSLPTVGEVEVTSLKRRLRRYMVSPREGPTPVLEPNLCSEGQLGVTFCNPPNRRICISTARVGKHSGAKT